MSGRTAPSGTPARGRVSNALPFVIVGVLGVAIFFMASAGRNPWDTLFINPLINALVLLDLAALGQFGLAIIVFTLLLRIATIPFTLRQLES
ncbi:MAG TPA: hypothetical protein VFT91_08520, partial [Dehalococcoidia bacterium]|nr:hypothetical protein [Dehalococcoidia bacterium]